MLGTLAGSRTHSRRRHFVTVLPKRALARGERCSQRALQTECSTKLAAFAAAKLPLRNRLCVATEASAIALTMPAAFRTGEQTSGIALLATQTSIPRFCSSHPGPLAPSAGGWTRTRQLEGAFKFKFAHDARFLIPGHWHIMIHLDSECGWQWELSGRLASSVPTKMATSLQWAGPGRPAP